MNFKAYRWAKSLKIKNAAQKAVLVALAGFADKDGFAWPSQDSLAEATSLTGRTVRAALKALEAQGYIAREKRGSRVHKGRSSDLILLGITAQDENKSKAFTGKSRPIYRKELPGINTGNNRYYPSQREKFSEGYSSVTLGGTGEFDPDSNVVPFPLERDVA
jgi:pyocin large subunit-like protein